MKNAARNSALDSYSKLLLIIYSSLLLFHWQLFPLFMDIYYHIHTAWGFIASGGYSGWDFWQFAPYGRPHIYPPFFHLILAFLMKIGAHSILLAKCFEILLPILFLVTAWHFMRKHYGREAGLFALVMCGSSFSFFLSLINHLPATLGLICALFSLDQLFQKKILRSALLLALCFYTHIGVSWLFALGFILFALFDKEHRRVAAATVASAIFLSAPLIMKQLSALKFVTQPDLQEKYLCEFKTLEYVLAFAGIIWSWRLKGKYRIFLSLFLSSFIFLRNPYRFFSAEGYFPIILLSSVTLSELSVTGKNGLKGTRYLLPGLVIFLLVISPTLLTVKVNDFGKTGLKVYYFDPAIIGLTLPERNQRTASATLWFPNEFIYDAMVISQNSDPGDIIYCRFPYVSVCLGSLSGRASAVGLLPDVKPLKQFDPFTVSKIIIVPQNEDPELLTRLISTHALIKIGENKSFVLYKNPSCDTKASFRKSSLPFAAIVFIGILFTFIYSIGGRGGAFSIKNKTV